MNAIINKGGLDVGNPALKCRTADVVPYAVLSDAELAALRASLMKNA